MVLTMKQGYNNINNYMCDIALIVTYIQPSGGWDKLLFVEMYAYFQHA
jgi:hypothetical protein